MNIIDVLTNPNTWIIILLLICIVKICIKILKIKISILMLIIISVLFYIWYKGGFPSLPSTQEVLDYFKNMPIYRTPLNF